MIKRGKRQNISDKTRVLQHCQKSESIIRCIFVSIIMHSNFMHFRQKISFKNALQIFTLVTGHLRTALKELMI